MPTIFHSCAYLHSLHHKIDLAFPAFIARIEKHREGLGTRLMILHMCIRVPPTYFRMYIRIR